MSNGLSGWWPTSNFFWRRNHGAVPSLSGLKKVTNKEVLQVYNDTFDQKDVRPAPQRRINNVLEKVLDVGRQTPEAALVWAIGIKKTKLLNR
jgi:hypothetical protein